ncbi:MAG: molybdopterin-dependent oxidoreductase [Candidatus Aminicenantia bacterium]
MDRRDFLKIAGGTTIGLALLEFPFCTLVPRKKIRKWQVEIERWIPSVCQECSGRCGIIVRVIGDRVVKIEGNPYHSTNRGKLCPKGHAGLQTLYNPDRLKGPMKKIGGKDSKEWKSISWEEAIDTVAKKLINLRNSGEPYSFVFWEKNSQGVMSELIGRFLEVYGSPNLIQDNSWEGIAKIHYLTQGVDKIFAYDFENSNYILSFRGDLLENWPSPIEAHRAYAHLRTRKTGKKAKIIQIDPRFSITAAKADKWIPINPGTEGVLALGIAYVIIKEELYNKNFITNYTFGFEDWKDSNGQTHIGFKSLVLAEYHLDYVSEITGVSVDTIIDLAKEFALSKPSVAVIGSNTTFYSNGLYNALSIHSLNALIGNVDMPGGILTQDKIPYSPFPEIERDNIAQKCLSIPRIDEAEGEKYPLASQVPSVIAEKIIKEEPYPIKILFLYQANPLFSLPDQKNLKKAFKKIPFIVSFSSFMDESTEWADLILPDHTYLEKWEDNPISPISYFTGLGISQPVIEPLYNTKHTGDVILSLAKKLGNPIDRNFPWKDFKELLFYKLEGIFKAQRGTIFTDSFEEAHVRLLEERGWWIPEYKTFDEFKKELLKKGGWWDPAYYYGKWGRVLRTPSRKFEFYSQLFEEKIRKSLDLKEENLWESRRTEKKMKELGINARGDKVFIAHYEPLRISERKEEYPFYLNFYQPLAFMNENGANQPWLQEIVGSYVNMKWDSWIEINPEKAKELGISENDWVWIESPFGKFRTRAKLFSGAMPEVVNIPYGFGHKALGQWAKDRGINPTELIGKDFDKLTGLPAKFSTKVKIYKA